MTANLARHGVPARLAGWAGSDPLSGSLLAQLVGRGVELALARRGRTRQVAGVVGTMPPR